MRTRENTIFDQLEEKGIPFAIVRSLTFATSIETHPRATDYFILIFRGDRDKVHNEWKFSSETFTLERTLSENEIETFHNRKNKEYKKVHHTKNGRVYELKRRPFKEYFESQLYMGSTKDRSYQSKLSTK